MMRPVRPVVRSVFAVLCCLAAAAGLVFHGLHHRPDSALMFGLAAGVVLAGGLLAARPFWAAIAGRGLAWTALAMITLCSCLDHPRASYTVGGLALCAALLAAGRHALDRAPATFRPNHHRGVLTLALVLGFADVAMLGGLALLAATTGGPLDLAALFAAMAAAIAVSLVGLFRLRTWGFLLNLAINLAVVTVMSLDALGFHAARIIFLVPAAAQILLALPVLVAIIRRRPITMPALFTRLAAFAPSAAILVMAALDVQVWFGEPLLIHLARWGMRHF